MSETASRRPEATFPLERTSLRALGEYGGPVDVWDIDNTYLITPLARLRDLLLRAFETALDKRARPGAVTLLRALRRGATVEAPPAPLYFVSASPPQLRAVLEEKMHIDGIAFDGISFKDHLSLIASGRLRELRRHTAYKLSALLEYRCEWPSGAREWLYGDDSEHDARIYSLYAAIRAGELSGGALEAELERLRVRKEDRRALVALAERASAVSPAPAGGSVEAIYIFEASPLPPLDLRTFPRVTPVRDALSLAQRLRERGRVGEDVVAQVAAEMEAAPVAEGGGSP